MMNIIQQATYRLQARWIYFSHPSKFEEFGYFVEETLGLLRDVTMLAYEIRHKRDLAATEHIKQKVEETLGLLRDVTMLAYEIRHKRDLAATEHIKQKEFYEQQKQVVLMAERILLSEMAFDFNVQHPYKYLVKAIKIFKVQ